MQVFKRFLQIFLKSAISGYRTNALPDESALVVFNPPKLADGVIIVHQCTMRGYCSSSTAACAAARRAMGTRNGEQDA